MKPYCDWPDEKIKEVITDIKNELSKSQHFWTIPVEYCPYTDDLIVLRVSNFPTMILVPTWMRFTFLKIKQEIENA